MLEEIEKILIEFDALWGGADSNSSKQEVWRKELAERILKHFENYVLSNVSMNGTWNCACGYSMPESLQTCVKCGRKK